MHTKKLIRCRSALERLEAQLKSGVKPTKIDSKYVDVPLKDADIKRINKEIDTLKKNLKI